MNIDEDEMQEVLTVSTEEELEEFLRNTILWFDFVE
jgi:hypothetical protein